jgi:type IV pilus assembly protein PilC
MQQLRRQGILPLPASIVEGPQASSATILSRWSDRVRPRDVALCTRQLAAMLDAGLPLVEALQILATRSTRARLRVILEQTRADIEAGVALAKALGRHPEAFGPMYIGMIGVGESAGVLDRILVRLADHIEKSLALKEQVRRALFYPAAVIAVAGCVTAALLLWVIPVFAELFASFGQALPLPTRIVIGASEATIAYGAYVILLAVLAGVAVRRVYAAPGGRALFDEALLKMPLVGGLVAKAAVARVTSCLATLLAAGVTVLDALAITAATSGNAAVERAVLAARAAVEAGRPLADPLGASGIFEPMVCQMIAVGERTGALDTMLERAAGFCQGEVDRVVAGALAVLEPVIMVVLGIVMGGLVISMYLPVFRLGNML